MFNKFKSSTCELPESNVQIIICTEGLSAKNGLAKHAIKSHKVKVILTSPNVINIKVKLMKLLTLLLQVKDQMMVITVGLVALQLSLLQILS